MKKWKVKWRLIWTTGPLRYNSFLGYLAVLLTFFVVNFQEFIKKCRFFFLSYHVIVFIF